MREVIRIAGKAWPPYIGRCFPNASLCGAEGLGVELELLEWLLGLLGHSNFSYHFDATTQSSQQDIVAGRADITAGTDSLAGLLAGTEALPTVASDGALFLTAAQPPSFAASSLLFETTDLRLWLAFIAIFLCLWLGRRLFDLSLRHKAKSRRRPHVITRLLSGTKPSDPTPPIPSKRRELARLVWWLVVMVTLGVYSNFLSIAFSKAPPKTPLFSSLSELAELMSSKSCRLGVPVGRDFLEDVGVLLGPGSHAEDAEDHLRLAKALEKNTPVVLQDQEAIARWVGRCGGCSVGVVYRSFRHVVRGKFCRLETLALDGVGSTAFAWVARKGAPFVGPLRDLLLAVGPNYVYEQHMRAYERRQRAADCDATPAHYVRPLRLGQLSDLFLLLVNSLFAASIAFAFEHMLKLFRREHPKASVFSLFPFKHFEPQIRLLNQTFSCFKMKSEIVVYQTTNMRVRSQAVQS